MPGSNSWYNDRWLQSLKLVVSITLLARGWLTLRWDSPIRGLLWNEERLTPLLQSWFNLSWTDYAENSDTAITAGLEWAGIGLMISSIIPWLPFNRRILSLLLTPSIGVLILDAVARWVGSGLQLGMSMEKSLQWGTPVALLLAITWLYQKKSIWLNLAKALAALTFIGHGLYAMGFHPVPWNYQSMTMDLTGLNEAGTLLFLKLAGYMDFVVAIAIFIRPIEKYALVYMVLWGGATALARFFSAPTSIDPWLIETLVRTVHWAVPLLILLGGHLNFKRPGAQS